MRGTELLLDGARGVYIPQNFVEEFDLTKWEGVDQDDIDTLLKGPDEEWYWDAWDKVLNNATHTDDHGNVWHLYQDGDLWEYCPELMDNETYRNVFGE